MDLQKLAETLPPSALKLSRRLATDLAEWKRDRPAYYDEMLQDAWRIIAHDMVDYVVTISDSDSKHFFKSTITLLVLSFYFQEKGDWERIVGQIELELRKRNIPFD